MLSEPSELEILRACLLLSHVDKKKKALKAAPGKENNNATKGKKTQVKAERNTPAVQWSKSQYFHYTDTLLTIIKEKPHYQQAFGFSKEPSIAPVTTGGQTIADLHAEVAKILFVTSENTPFVKSNMSTLQKVVSNRITVLKKQYREHRANLGETGQGLVENGQEDEIQVGSELENIWDAIKAKFSWYSCMHVLLGTSPIVDRSAVANSQTMVDLSVLEMRKKKLPSQTPKKSKKKAQKGESSGSDSDSSSNSSGGEDAEDEEDEKEADEDHNKSSEADTLPSSPPHCCSHSSQPPRTPAPTLERTPAPPSTHHDQKQKSMYEHVQDLTTDNRSPHIKIVKLREREKTEREQIKHKIKHDIEVARMTHEERQAERQREHKLRMMWQQIELEHL